jgi:hypothetical protein
VRAKSRWLIVDENRPVRVARRHASIIARLPLRRSPIVHGVDCRIGYASGYGTRRRAHR